MSPDLLRHGYWLEHHHPGTVQTWHGPGVNHCIVAFIGLEDEPISLDVGFDHEEDGHYRGLLVPTDTEWERAISAGWWDRTCHS